MVFTKIIIIAGKQFIMLLGVKDIWQETEVKKRKEISLTRRNSEKKTDFLLFGG